MKKLVFRTMVAIFLGFILTNPLTGILISDAEITQKETFQYTSSVLNEYEIVDAMSITEESDFVSTGWSSNGSIQNPFVLEYVHIIFNEYPPQHQAIFISEVDCHFIIHNCLFTGNGNGVTFSHAANGQITSCLFNGSNSAINLNDCSNVTVFNNTVINGKDGFYANGNNIEISHNVIRVEKGGISSGECQDLTIFNNTILHCDTGILYYGRDVIIVDNLVAGCVGVGIVIEGGWGNNTIYGNYICFNGYSNAIDNSLGYETKWDDGVSQGNYWSDLGENETYTIPGAAGAIDRFPSIFTEDVIGPQIIAEEYDEDLTIDGAGESFTFRANVSDVSGVDTVLFYFTLDDVELSNWSVYEMERANDPLNPDLFVITFEKMMPDYITFYIWANDSLGNFVRSASNHIWFHARQSSIFWTEYVPYILGSVVLGGIHWLGVFVRKERTPPIPND